MSADDDDYAFEYDDEDGGDLVMVGASAADAVAVPASTLPTTASGLKRMESYERADVADVASRVETVVAELAETLGLTPDEAMLACLAYTWQVDKLKEAWVDDEAKTRARCGITCTGPDPAPLPAGVSATDEFDDPIAFTTVSYALTDAMPCGHRASNENWQGHLTAAITADENGALATKCLYSGDGCEEVVRPRLFKTHLPPHLYARYVAAQTRSFASSRPGLRACPAPGCTGIVLDRSGGTRTVNCPAAHAFCSKCSMLGGHAPATCDESARWQKLTGGEGGDNTRWLLANTKPCPRCKTPIEKNEGCIHMTCRTSAGCTHEFCWLCLGDWKTHGGYNCNKPPPTDLYDHGKAAAAKMELARTAFYELRFANHSGGETLARQHLAAAGKDEDLLMSFGLTNMQASFLKEAIAVIAAGRHAAKWTYVHAFFITDPREQALFQDMQARLEHNLEQLHGMVNSKALQAFIAKSSEGSIGTIVGDMLMRRQTIMDFARATQQFTTNILEACETGLLGTAADVDASSAAAGAASGGSGTV